MALNLNLPFREIINNLDFYDSDTVFCISSIGTEYKGILKCVSLSSYIQLTNHKTQFEFKYYAVKPCRMVLIEKKIFK